MTTYFEFVAGAPEAYVPKSSDTVDWPAEPLLPKPRVPVKQEPPVEGYEVIEWR